MYSPMLLEKDKWRAVVAPELGANVVLLQYADRDVLVPLESESQLDVNPYLQGMPILLPANRTANGRFTFEGKTYFLPVNEEWTGAHLHGLVHRQIFTVTEKTQTAITLQFENTDTVYPFPFVLTVTYSLEQDAFVQYYTVKNTGCSNMPFTFATHTTFVEPDNFTVPIECCQEKDAHHIPTGKYVPLNAQEMDYVTGSVSKGLTITGYFKACGHTAIIGNFAYTVSDHFDHWILFNGKGESGLLCIEPQCGKVNGLNIPDGCRVLKPGETARFTAKIYKR